MKQDITKDQIPIPILLNRMKHHAGFVKDRITEINESRDEIREELLIIGESQMDFYHGKFSPGEISQCVIDQLKQINALENSKYVKWIKMNKKNYQTLTLPDASVWTLRLANDSQRHVHIHPGRYSPHTLRVKALTLKTAIAVLVHSKFSGKNPDDIEMINIVRKDILNESPIKSIEYAEGLLKVIDVLS